MLCLFHITHEKTPNVKFRPVNCWRQHRSSGNNKMHFIILSEQNWPKLTLYFTSNRSCTFDTLLEFVVWFKVTSITEISFRFRCTKILIGLGIDWGPQLAEDNFSLCLQYVLLARKKLIEISQNYSSIQTQGLSFKCVETTLPQVITGVNSASIFRQIVWLNNHRHGKIPKRFTLEGLMFD